MLKLKTSMFSIKVASDILFEDFNVLHQSGIRYPIFLILYSPQIIFPFLSKYILFFFSFKKLAFFFFQMTKKMFIFNNFPLPHKIDPFSVLHTFSFFLPHTKIPHPKKSFPFKLSNLFIHTNHSIFFSY